MGLIVKFRQAPIVVTVAALMLSVLIMFDTGWGNGCPSPEIAITHAK